MQIPRLLGVIGKENTLLSRIVRKRKIDLVVSDNRYGFYAKKVPSIFITHQVHLLMPSHMALVSSVVNGINRRLINNFSALWIPDGEGEFAISGKLGQSNLPSIPHNYLGHLSRMEKMTCNKEYDIAVVLSGPEPQRSILEEKVLDQLKGSNNRVLLVRGLPNEKERLATSDNIDDRSHLTSKELNKAICASTKVICRSGYSSIMDLLKLQKPALLIPTPGQTEQEYLAKMLSGNDQFQTQKQEELNVLKGLEQLPTEVTSTSTFQENYRSIIDEALAKLAL